MKTPTSNYKQLADFMQQQRRNRRISIRKISLMTSLPETTIRALENPNKSRLPKSNVLGLYRVYGGALGVSNRRIRDLAGKQEEIKPEFSIKRLPKLKSLVVFTNIGTTIMAGAIVSVIVTYAAWQGYGLVSSPSLRISSPMSEYSVVGEAGIEVSGSASVEASVLINGQPTTVNNESGEFSQMVYLQKGYNNLNIEVVNSFSTSTSRSFVVVYEPEDNTANLETL